MSLESLVRWAVGDQGQAILAGALGGVVRWLSLREKWSDGIISITVGAICALYINPIAIPVLEPVLGHIVINPDSRVGFSGFIIGIGGIAVSGFIIDMIHAAKTRRLRKDEAEKKDEAK